MRSSLLVAVAAASGVLSSSGCYMDGAFRAPTWNNMTSWWRNPKTEASPTAMAGGPSVHLPSSASPAPGAAGHGAAVPGAPGALTANTHGGAAPAYDATKASYTNVSPNMYPNTGMASFNSPGGATRANTAAYDGAPRGANGYSTGGAYDTRSGQDYAQAGPYDSVYGAGRTTGSAQPANSPPANTATPNPYANPATPAITDRSLAASAQPDRYGDNSAANAGAANTAGANHYLPAQNDPRVAARDTSAANNPLVNPGTVRTRQEQPYQPGATGYNPGQTGYQPPANVGYDPTASGASAGLPANTAAPSAYQTQATASPRRDSTWSPGGTSRYPGANPAATTATNTLPPTTATRDPQPGAAYHDPNTPDAPARTADPSRYDDMR